MRGVGSRCAELYSAGNRLGDCVEVHIINARTAERQASERRREPRMLMLRDSSTAKGEKSSDCEARRGRELNMSVIILQPGAFEIVERTRIVTFLP